MDVKALAEHITKSANEHERFIVAIAGPPGAGKSTVATELTQALRCKSIRARIVPMDGFHLDNSILSERGILPQKGAAETFDGNGFVNLVKRIASGENGVAIPVFDRASDKSIAGADIVSAEDQIIIVEGNYLFLDLAPWSDLHAFWDETIFINPGFEILEKRLIDRWLKHGLSATDAKKRALSNDIPNARTVLEKSRPANIQITNFTR